MRTCLILAGMLAVSAVAFSQTSFDQHFALAKQGKLGEREAIFAKQCGIQRSDAVISYGRSLDENWHFKRVNSVGKGRDDAEMDFLGNAELWSVSGKPRLINVWFLIMDTGNSSNELFCLDESGHVVSQESLNVFEPVDGSPSGWRRLSVTSFPGTRQARVTKNLFLDKAGKQIPKPKLSREDLEQSNGSSSPDLAQDLIAKLSRKGK